MDIRHCKKQTNIDHALSMTGEAIAKGAELIVLPEVFSTGFCYDTIEKNAECVLYPTIEALRELSKERDCILIGSIIEVVKNVIVCNSTKNKFVMIYQELSIKKFISEYFTLPGSTSTNSALSSSGNTPKTENFPNFFFESVENRPSRSIRTP